MQRSPRIGIIGIGNFCSHYHIPNLLQQADVEIPAVCDISADRLENRNAGLRECREFTNYRQLITSGLIDGVIVSTPNACHFEQCRFALLNGVHVLVDKPLTMTADEAKTLVHLSQEKQLVLMTAFTRHFMGSVEYVRQHIASGDLGPLRLITAVQCRHPHRRPPIHGGMLLARAVHITDVCPWLTNLPVTRVEAQIEYDSDGCETFADIRMFLNPEPSGQLGETIPVRFVCVQDSEVYHDEVTVYGAKRSFRIEQRQLYESAPGSRWSPVTALPECSNSTAYFVDAVRGQVWDSESSLADFHSADGLRALQVLEAAVESSRIGGGVELDLST